MISYFLVGPFLYVLKSKHDLFSSKPKIAMIN